MNIAGGFVIACIAPVLFYLYIFGALKKGNSLSEIKTLKKTDWFFSFVILFGITGIICILIKQNHFIYYWDYGREWTTAISVSHDLFEAPLSALKGIYHSINEEDYNRFMPILIALPLKLLGNSFARYVVINQVFYMCPALFMISLLAYKILRKFQIVRTRFWNVLLFVAATPIIYYVLLDGFMDPPVLLLISGVLMLSLDFDFRRMDISRCVLIAIGLLLLVLFRRHFAYWVVGYVFSILFVAIYQFINNKEDRKIIFKNYVTDMFVIGGISLAVLLTAFNRFLMRSVFNNFYYAYNAYDVSYGDKFGRILIVFGWGILFMAIVLAPLMCRFYKGLVAVIATYFINIALATFLLWRELQMNWHQYYLIVIQVMIMACIGLFGLAERLEKKKGNVLAAVGMVWGIAGMVICYVPAFNGVNICNLFSTRYYEAKVRNDLEEVNSLIECVNSLANESNGKWAYVLSSSRILNSDTLRKAGLPYDNNPVPHLFLTKDIDLRDGFPIELFAADVVIVGEPEQTHAPKETQQVITYFTDLILDPDSYLGRHYDFVDRFKLEDGVTANVYIRNSHYDRDDYEKLQQHFDEIYGDYPELFHDLIVYPEPFFPDETGEELVLTGDDGVFTFGVAESEDNYVSTTTGYLVYGPAKRIEKGVYNITFQYDYDGDIENGEALGMVDMCLSLNVIASAEFYAGNTEVRLEGVVLDDADDRCELRMYVNVPGIEFKSVVIEKVE